MTHRWTSDDERRWRKLAHVAGRVLTEARPDGRWRYASLGDLKAAAKRAFPAVMPVTKEHWAALRLFMQLAEDFADKDDGYRTAWTRELARRTSLAHGLLGLTPPPGLGEQADAPAAPERKPPHWLE